MPATTRRLTADKESEAQRGQVIYPVSQSMTQGSQKSVLVADTEHMQESEEATTNLEYFRVSVVSSFKLSV